jgi:hypothetical protein
VAPSLGVTHFIETPEADKGGDITSLPMGAPYSINQPIIQPINQPINQSDCGMISSHLTSHDFVSRLNMTIYGHLIDKMLLNANGI